MDVGEHEITSHKATYSTITQLNYQVMSTLVLKVRILSFLIYIVSDTRASNWNGLESNTAAIVGALNFILYFLNI